MKDPSNFKDTSYFEREDFNQPSYNMINNKISKNRYEIKLSTNKVDFDFTNEKIIPSPVNIYVQNIGYNPIDCLDIKVTGNYKVTQDDLGKLKPNGIKNIKIEYDSTKNESIQGSLNITAIDCIGNGFVIINGKTNPPDPIDPDNPDKDKDKDKDINSSLSLKHFYPPVNKNIFVSGNNAQTVLYEDGRYYSWFLYNENVDIHYKEDGKYLRNIDGGTSYAMITSKNLVDWTFRDIVIPKGIDLPKYNNSSLNTTSIGSGSVLKYKDLFYYYVTLADQNIALFTTDDITKPPVFKQIVLPKQTNTEIFHDPDVKYINNTFIMALGVSDLTPESNGINYYTSIDGLNWQLKKFFNIPEFSRIDSPRIFRNVYEKDVLIYNGIHTDQDNKSEVRLYTGILNECSSDIFTINSNKYILDYGSDFFTPYLFEEELVKDSCNSINDNWSIYSWFGNWNYQALLPIEPVNGLFGVKKLNNDFTTSLHPNIIDSYNNTINRKEVTYTGLNSNTPIKYLPETCVIDIQIDKPLETKEYFSLSSGAVFKAQLTKTDKGFKFQRKNWGNFPSFDTSLWDIEYDIPSDNINTNIKLFLDRNSLEIIIDDKYYATFVLIYPLGACKFISSFIIQRDNENNIIRQNSYSGSFKLYYDHMPNKVTGSITEEEVNNLIDDKNYGCTRYPKARVNEDITLIGVVKKDDNCEVIKKVTRDLRLDCIDLPVYNTGDYSELVKVGVAKSICKEEDCKECFKLVKYTDDTTNIAAFSEKTLYDDGVERNLPIDKNNYSAEELYSSLKYLLPSDKGSGYVDLSKGIADSAVDKNRLANNLITRDTFIIKTDGRYQFSYNYTLTVDPDNILSVSYVIPVIDNQIFLSDDNKIAGPGIFINTGYMAGIQETASTVFNLAKKDNYTVEFYILPRDNSFKDNTVKMFLPCGKIYNGIDKTYRFNTILKVAVE